ncbi:AAA family ATPase [Cohnella luojiensis]|nr:ATP/GTP-binding protein [Cohnella luojiensis]
MLMRFNVKNFLSFFEEQEFTMIPGTVRNKEEHLLKGKNINLLRLATIYGPNAAGKSNLIKALSFSKNVIQKGILPSSKNKFFRLNNDAPTLPTTFEYEFNIGDSYFAYGFSLILAESKFTGEWLYELKTSGESLIYERNLTLTEFNHNLIFENEDSQTRFRIYSEDIISNSKVLFLSEINRNKEDVFKKFKEFKIFSEIYNWFDKTLDINFPDKPISSTEFFLENDRNNNDKLFKLLESLGTGITEFKLVDTSLDELNRVFPSKLIKDIEEELIGDEDSEGVVHLRSQNNLHLITLDTEKNLDIKTMHFSHGLYGGGGDFTLGEESDGTKRLLDLLEILIGEEDKVYIIDEIDRSLHPNLTYQFIHLFLEILKDKKIQLIVTTHEDRILDLDLLRRDEIWFVEKSENGSSELYSLEKYKTRFDKKIINSYLDGRYGAVPKFKNVAFLNNLDDIGDE